MQEPKEPLSERELEILRLVATGAANKEIARRLVISPNTVKVHLRNIFTKINVASRTEATLYAINIGLITPTTSESAENESAAASTSQGPVEDFSTSGPAFTDETSSSPRAWTVKRWYIPVAILIGLLLMIAGATAFRYLNTPIPRPTQTLPAPAGQEVNPRWSKKANLPEPRKGMGAAVYENAFYLIGGETNTGIDSATLKYDPVRDSWNALAKKPTPVSDASAAVIGEKIYVPGGRLSNGQMTNVLEVYDPRRDAWQTKTALPIPLGAYGLVAFEGQIFVFGGKTDQGYTSSVYSYDTERDQWTERGSLSSARAYSAAAVLDGKIYLFGGFDGQSALDVSEVFYPNRDTTDRNNWEALSPLPSPRYGMGVTNIGNIIFLVGGLGSSELKIAAPVALQYLPDSDSWGMLDASTETIGAFPALLSSGYYLYVIGGEANKQISVKNLAYQAIYTIAVPIISGGE